jgi:hypothetical protein
MITTPKEKKYSCFHIIIQALVPYCFIDNVSWSIGQTSGAWSMDHLKQKCVMNHSLIQHDFVIASWSTEKRTFQLTFIITILSTTITFQGYCNTCSKCLPLDSMHGTNHCATKYCHCTHPSSFLIPRASSVASFNWCLASGYTTVVHSNSMQTPQREI